MKFTLQYAAVVGAVLAATAGSAFAGPLQNVPEPGTLALVGAAVAALVIVSRKNKK